MSTSNLERLRQGLVGVLAALALAGCGEKAPPSAPGSALALTKITVQTDWYAQPEHGGFYQALVKGYYREVGLDVTISQGGPNAIPRQKVALGTVEFGVGRTDELIVAAGQGVPLVAVGAIMQHDPQAVMFHRQSGIRSFKDLAGRTIMAEPGAVWLKIVEKKIGLKLSLVPLDFGLSRFLADKNFIQQCFITNEPFYVRQQGAEVGTLLLSDAGIAPYRIWYTSRSFMTKNPEAVRAFAAASIRGWREYVDGDRKEADTMIRALNPKMTPEFIAYGVGAMREFKLVHGDAAKGEQVGQIDPVRLADEIAQLTSIGVLGRPVRLAEVFDETFLPEEVRAGATRK
jgi:NitT/TauT family transport system substrate-binding protein